MKKSGIPVFNEWKDIFAFSKNPGEMAWKYVLAIGLSLIVTCVIVMGVMEANGIHLFKFEGMKITQNTKSLVAALRDDDEGAAKRYNVTDYDDWLPKLAAVEGLRHTRVQAVRHESEDPETEILILCFRGKLEPEFSSQKKTFLIGRRKVVGQRLEYFINDLPFSETADLELCELVAADWERIQ